MYYYKDQPNLWENLLKNKVAQLFKNVCTADGMPYSLHCDTVALFAKSLLIQYRPNSLDYVSTLVAAYGHDILEDLGQQVFQEYCEFVIKLFDFFGSKAQAEKGLDGIRYYLTYYKKTISRGEYIANIAKAPKEFEFVKFVKLGDLSHNGMISRKKPSWSQEWHLTKISTYLAEYNIIEQSLVSGD